MRVRRSGASRASLWCVVEPVTTRPVARPVEGSGDSQTVARSRGKTRRGTGPVCCEHRGLVSVASEERLSSSSMMGGTERQP